MSDNLNICAGLLKVSDEEDESSRKDQVQRHKVLEEDGYSHIAHGISKLLVESDENSSVCKGPEVKNEDKNDWTSFLYEGSETAEGGHVTCGLANINKLDYSSYADVLWEIVCKNCFFVSETLGLEYHKCEINEDENISTEKLIRCDKCGLSLSNNETLEDHESSRAHILLFLNKKGDDYIDELNHYYCSLCKIQSLSHTSYYMHVLGEQHRSLYTELQFHCLSYCVSCKFTMDKKGKDMHLSSKTHFTKSLLKENTEY